MLVKVIFLITFLIGGALQIVGLASNTTITFITVVGLFLYYANTKNRIDGYKPLKGVLALVLCMMLSSIFNEFNLPLLLLYAVMFAMTPLVIYKFIYKSLRGRMDIVFKFLLVVGFIQLPVILLQRTLFSSIMAISARAVSETDIGFGTFFVANDHALCFLLLCLINYMLNYEKKLPGKIKIGAIIWFSLTILLSNSRISSLFLVIVFSVFFLKNASLRAIFLILGGLIVFWATLVFSGLYDLFETKYTYIYDKIFEKEYDLGEVYKSVERGIASRGEIFYYYMDQPIKIIGEGPYTYFDPITKKFALLPNFSQLIWFYNDIGLIGVIFGIILVFRIYFRHQNLKSPAISYLLMMIVYSYFANTFSDLAFLIIFYLFIINSIDVGKKK